MDIKKASVDWSYINPYLVLHVDSLPVLGPYEVRDGVFFAHAEGFAQYIALNSLGENHYIPCKDISVVGKTTGCTGLVNTLGFQCVDAMFVLPDSRRTGVITLELAQKVVADLKLRLVEIRNKNSIIYRVVR